MITRADLETPRTPNEMKEVLDQFSADRITYPDRDVHLRKGIIKVLLEEYDPLHILARAFGNECRAWLTHPSNQGPDSLIQLKSGREFAVQITVANQSHENALGRERLSQGQHTFPASKKERNSQSGEIKESGRILATREGWLRGQVQDLVNSIENKNTKFYDGTDILLVSTRIRLDDSCIEYSWRDDLTDKVQKLCKLRYLGVYVANGYELITISQPWE